MARSDHCGEPTARRKQVGTRAPRLGYYYILTDTDETEKQYLEGIGKLISKGREGKITVRVHKAPTSKMVSKCMEGAALRREYSEPWIVFDRDRVAGFDEIIREAETAGIHVGWSNPCIEIFFFAYYSAMPTIAESKRCCEKFDALFQKKTGQEYNKADSAIFSKLRKSGDEAEALRRAAERRAQHQRDGMSLPSKMCPCTTLDILVSELLSNLKK